jgi:hypothetical protein
VTKTVETHDTADKLVDLSDRLDYLLSVAREPLKEGEPFEPGDGLGEILDKLRKLTVKVGKTETKLQEAEDELEGLEEDRDRLSAEAAKAQEEVDGVRGDLKRLISWALDAGADPFDVRGRLESAFTDEMVRSMALAPRV